MGLSNFPSPAEGVLPVLVMNTVMSVAILKNLLRSFLQLVGAVNWATSNFETNPTTSHVLAATTTRSEPRRLRGISITQFKYLCANNSNNSSYCGKNKSIGDGNTKNGLEGECCVCLCKFEDEEEVSELSCKHFFHRNCLEKWFDNHHTTCPLCRSIH